MDSRNLSSFLSFVQPNPRIEYSRRSFLQFFSRFQHFSNSISLSLFHLSFTNPARDRYIPVRLTFHSFGRLRRSKNILFNRERNFDTYSSNAPPSDCFHPPSWKEEASYFNATSFALLDFTSRASWTKKTSSCVRLDRWFGRGLHAHKYRNVVVRTDSGTEQSPFRNTCRLASPPSLFLLNQISPTYFFARRFSTDRHKSLPSLVLSLRFESIFQIIPVIPWKFSN